jgi:hypothetical protein
VSVRRFPPADEHDLDQPRTVELQAADRFPAELALLDGDERLGVVGTRDHTDVLDVLASGLDVMTALLGDTLTFTVVDGTTGQGGEAQPPS